MKIYKLVMNGRNYLIQNNGKPRKQGFYQVLVVEAESPQRADWLARAKIRHDKAINDITLNKPADPPEIHLHTFWELDLGAALIEPPQSPDFYPEKKWWQFWKKAPQPGDLLGSRVADMTIPAP